VTRLGDTRMTATAAYMRVALTVLVAGALALGGASTAAALTGTDAPPANIAGKWDCCGSGGAAATVLDITETGTGAIGGTVGEPSGGSFGNLSGSVTGSNASIVETYTTLDPGYVATFDGTVGSDAKTMSGNWTSNGGQSGTWSAMLASPAVPPPVLAKSVDATPVSGTVRVELPGKHGFVLLKAGAQVPVGSLVDTTHGVVALTAADRLGQTTHGTFYDGLFRITAQRAGTAELTVLTLAGPKPTGCGTALDASTARKHPHRSLWGSASGNFKTSGSYGSATERGTKWLTEDTCAGTLIRVTQGSVIVDDFPHHRTFVLRAPRSFLAHPGKGG
jgi:hypothetical protein